jgi:DNA helicase-2/ATP-dependent DNA helicase PcrA
MRSLYLTYAESRRLYGRDSYPRPSRFLREVPAECLQEVRMRGTFSRPVAATPASSQAPAAEGRFKLGQRVRHAKFGEGVVLNIEGEGAQERAQINFRNVGTKWLMLAYAQLEVL